MNIIMISNTYAPIVGGVEHSLSLFASQYRKMGHNVLIITLEFEESHKKEEQVIRLPALRHFNGTDFSVRLPIPAGLMPSLVEFSPDIIHSHHPFMLGDTALRIAKEFQIPLVFTHHTRFEEYTHYVPFDNQLVKKLVIELTAGYEQLADLIFAPSASIRDEIIDRGVKTTVEVVPTGVDISLFSKGNKKRFLEKYNISSDNFILGTVCRLAKEKNLRFLVKSVTKFLQNNKNTIFVVVGDGDEYVHIKEMIASCKIEEKVIFTKTLTGLNLVDAYTTFDVFLFSSKSETQGMVLLESMAAGTPVIALKACGVKDIILEKQNGMIVEDENVDDFNDAIEWYYHQKFSSIKRMRKSAIEFSRSLSVEKMGIKAIELYESVIQEELQFKDIEQTLWGRTLRRLGTEFELIHKTTEAIGSSIKENVDFKIKESFLQKIKKTFDSNEWSASLFKLKVTEGMASKPGIIMIQIDGLSIKELKLGIKRGRMPFLKMLLKKEKYKLQDFYSGQPSCTPAVQGELFYGIKGIVPSFAFLDDQANDVFCMYDQLPAVEIENRLARMGEGLLIGGSSYSNIFSGGAQETHFCACDLGFDKLWRKVKLYRIILLTLIHFWGILKIIFHVILELISSIFDFILGVITRHKILKELKFLMTRIFICVLLRDLIIFCSKIDIVRGMPIIHMTFLAYDEHAHRRGSASNFARRKLNDIDKCIHKIYKAAKNSKRRDYDVWIYSDHGQEVVLSYVKLEKKFVHAKIRELLLEFRNEEFNFESYGVDELCLQRSSYIGNRIIQFLNPQKHIDNVVSHKDRVVVTSMGPLGNIYLYFNISESDKDLFAQRLVSEKHIPLVFRVDEKNNVKAWNKNGVFSLPDQAKYVFGNDHPYLKEVTDDFIVNLKNKKAGDFVISGWSPSNDPWSFPIECGSHGGPGYSETSAFLLLPSDILKSITQEHLRPLDLRNAALRFMGRIPDDMSLESYSTNRTPKKSSKQLRVMTYNVHSCRGMDSKISVERIARVISRMDPDIVALQELDVNKYRSGKYDQPHLIAKELKMHYHFAATISLLEDEHYGNAILSKYPIELVKEFELPNLPFKKDREPRGALWVRVKFNELSVQVINTHLGLNRKERIQQLNALLGPDLLASKDCKGPLILLGDFNSWPSSTVYKKLSKKYKDAQEVLDDHQPQATWFGHLPVGRIDHVFLSQDITITKVEVPRTYLEKVASDHLPLVVELELM